MFFIKSFCFFIILISHHWTLILGDGHFVACSCMLISRNSSIVFKGSSPLQTDVSLWQVPIICSLCLHHLVSYCVVFSSDVLDFGLCLKSNWTYRGCLLHDESCACQPCVNPQFSSFTFWLLFIVIYLLYTLWLKTGTNILKTPDLFWFIRKAMQSLLCLYLKILFAFAFLRSRFAHIFGCIMFNSTMEERFVFAVQMNPV